MADGELPKPLLDLEESYTFSNEELEHVDVWLPEHGEEDANDGGEDRDDEGAEEAEDDEEEDGWRRSFGNEIAFL